MKKIGLYGFCTLILMVLVSCNSVFDKPLSELLSEEEEKTLTENQAHFYSLLKRQMLMNAVVGNMNTKLLDEISYKDFFDYLETVKAKTPQWTEEAHEEWNKKYAQIVEKTIACYDKWLKWEKDNYLTSKIKVKLVSIDKIGFPNTFTLSFKSEMGPINSIKVDFGFGERTNHSFFVLYPRDKYVTEGVVEENSYIDLPDDFNNMSIEEALKKHPFCYELVSANVADAAGNVKLHLGSDHLKEIPGPVRAAMSKAKHREITNLEGATFHEAIKNIATKVLELEYTTPQKYLDNYCYEKCEELDEDIYKVHRSLIYLSNR